MSTFDWTSEDRAARMGDGYHFATIVKVKRAKASGDEFKTKDGHGQLLVVFGNDSGEEHGEWYDLGGANTWKIKRLCQRMGLDVAKMKAANITPAHFEDEKWAGVQLKGRTGWIEVTTNGKFVNADPIAESEVPIDIVKRHSNPTAHQPTVDPMFANAQRRTVSEPVASLGHTALDSDSIPFTHDAFQL